MLGRDVNPRHNPRHVAMPVRLQMEMEEHRAVHAGKPRSIVSSALGAADISVFQKIS